MDISYTFEKQVESLKYKFTKTSKFARIIKNLNYNLTVIIYKKYFNRKISKL